MCVHAFVYFRLDELEEKKKRKETKKKKFWQEMNEINFLANINGQI